MSEKVSFTIRRPTPVSRAASSGLDSDSGSSFKVPSLPRHLVNDSTPGSPLARSDTSSPRPYTQNSDSDEEDDEAQDELVTGFDQFGVERLNKPKKAPQGPLVIPALKNRDWREAARRRRTAGQFVPESARAQKAGADGSVGGLGTKDTINNGPVLAGLQIRKKEIVKQEVEDAQMMEVSVKEEEELVTKVEETEDQRALRALLSEANREEVEGTSIGIIPAISEADAYKQDVDELPDSATLDDYNRIPVSQFGAAMLRGMGWKEGTAASRKGKGMVQPYIPEARPALLGIGAKEIEVFDDGSNRNKGNKRPERRYVPVVKKDKDGNIVSDSDRPDQDRHRDRGRDRDRRRDRSTSPRRDSRVSSRRSSPDGRYSSRRDRDYDYDREGDRDRERKRDKDRDRERGREKSDRSYRRDRSREPDRRRREDY